MNAVALTNDTFARTTEENDIVIVDFWAQWCGPCRAFAPVFEAAAAAHPDIVFGKVDTEAEQDLAASFQIRSIPTLMIFREQLLLVARPGFMQGPELEDLIGKVRELDMDEVRREIAEQDANTA